MRGGIARIINTNAMVAYRLCGHLKGGPVVSSSGRSLLWINKRACQCSATVLSVRLFTADSALADEVSTQFWEIGLVADWQSDLLDWWRWLISDIGDLFGQGYGQAPALLLGLSLVVIVPLFVVAGVILRRTDAVTEPDRTVRYPAARKMPTTNPPQHSHRVPALGDASVHVQDEGSSELAEYCFNGALMVRIGREEDNDVRLSDPTVHRYHAVISRSADVGYVVSDLSSSDGNGVIVNGERVRRQRLNDGDIITLGTAKLTFRLQ